MPALKRSARIVFIKRQRFDLRVAKRGTFGIHAVECVFAQHRAGQSHSSGVRRGFVAREFTNGGVAGVDIRSQPHGSFEAALERGQQRQVVGVEGLQDELRRLRRAGTQVRVGLLWLLKVSKATDRLVQA